MVTQRPKIVIIGAGMAGLTAANKLYTSSSSHQLFDLAVVEGGTRIGGRISSSDFCGDRIEQGATWIHGIDGSPVYKIAEATNALVSDQPWECMDGIPHHPVTVAEGGHPLNPLIVEPISKLFKTLMDFVQGEDIGDEVGCEVVKHCGGGKGSVGDFLRRGMEKYLSLVKDRNGVNGVGNWKLKAIQEGVFAMHESTQRTFTSAHDLGDLDCLAEKEYVMFPGEEITIAKGYSSVIESLASALPVGMIQLGRKVEKIEWRSNGTSPGGSNYRENGNGHKPVKLHFCDGSTMSADHVIVTVSLGVLKQAIFSDNGLFNPPLPEFKTGAISRLGYGVVDKIFLRIGPKSDNQHQNYDSPNFPFLQMVFHPPDSDLTDPKIPPWIRRTSFISPIYSNSRTLISWFTGPEALELESLPEEDIISGFSATLSNFLPSKTNCQKPCNGKTPEFQQMKLEKILRTQWGTNPLFLGSYSYIAVGSSIRDMDKLSEPLPLQINGKDSAPPPLQILFAGEATHSTHYSTTHGAFFSGLREANRLLKHYNYINGV